MQIYAIFLTFGESYFEVSGVYIICGIDNIGLECVLGCILDGQCSNDVTSIFQLQTKRKYIIKAQSNILRFTKHFHSVEFFFICDQSFKFIFNCRDLGKPGVLH